MKTDEFADALFKHYVEPYAKNKTAQRMKNLINHELTCGDLSHGHGVIQVKWDAPGVGSEEQKQGEH